MILVTSPGAGDGKTLCALNLALALGEGGQAKVLLLEANFRALSLARLLGFQPPGLFEQQLEYYRALNVHSWDVAETASPWLHEAAVAPDNRRRAHTGWGRTGGVHRGHAVCLATITSSSTAPRSWERRRQPARGSADGVLMSCAPDSSLRSAVPEGGRPDRREQAPGPPAARDLRPGPAADEKQSRRSCATTGSGSRRPAIGLHPAANARAWLPARAPAGLRTLGLLPASDDVAVPAPAIALGRALPPVSPQSVGVVDALGSWPCARVLVAHAAPDGTPEGRGAGLLDRLALLTPRTLPAGGGAPVNCAMCLANRWTTFDHLVVDLTGFDHLGEHVAAYALLDAVALVARSGRTTTSQVPARVAQAPGWTRPGRAADRALIPATIRTCSRTFAPRTCTRGSSATLADGQDARSPARRRVRATCSFAICDHYEPLVAGRSTRPGRARVRAWVERVPGALRELPRCRRAAAPAHLLLPRRAVRPRVSRGACHALAGATWPRSSCTCTTTATRPDGLRRRHRREPRGVRCPRPHLARRRGAAALRLHPRQLVPGQRPADGRHCGVDAELPLLFETGCYADFTFPRRPTSASPTSSTESTGRRRPCPATRLRARPPRPGRRAPGRPRASLIEGPLARAAAAPPAGCGSRPGI